jgi:5-methylcytosine-specific restriction endonuclease McrA
MEATDVRTCLECSTPRPLTEYHRQSNAPLGRRARCRQCVNPRALRYKEVHSEGPAFEDRTCAHCSRVFRFYSALDKARPGQGKYCSMACKSASGRKTVQCEKCGAPFVAWLCKKRRFCSLECAGRITLSTLSRGPHLYGSRPWREIRASIIERDGGHCLRCLSTLRLLVHHIVPWRVSRDNSPDNLATVCKSCHAYIHGVSRSKDFVPVGV